MKQITIEDVYPNAEKNIYLKKMFSILEDRIKHNISKDSGIYTERHHIIPKCWYKRIGIPVDNTKSNIVNVTFSEHIILHILLKKYFESIDDRYMFYAMASSVHRVFSSCKSKQDFIEDHILDFSKNDILDEVQKSKALSIQSMKEKIKGSKWYTDGKKIIRLKDGENIPDNFENKFPDSIKRIWINDGKHEMRVSSKNNIPDGWTLGRIPEIALKLKNVSHKAGLKFRYANNGIQNITLKYNDEIPKGYVLGRIPDHKIWITNGKRNRKVSPNYKIPNGWKIGMLHKLEVNTK